MQIVRRSDVIIVVCLCILFGFRKHGHTQESHYSFYDNKNLDVNSTDYRNVVDIADSLMSFVYNVHKPDDYRYRFIIVDSVFAASFMSDTLKVLFDKYYNYRIKKASRDYGLKLTGYYNYNFQPGFSDEEELYYRQRAYVGIDWNLLDNGFFGNREQVEKMKIDLEINRFEREREVARENFIYRYNFITFIFNRLMIQLIEKRLDILDGLEKIALELFYKRSITWEDVLKIKEKINSMELEYTGYYDYNWFNEWDLDIYPEKYTELRKMPFLDVNPVKIMTMSEVNYTDSTLLDLKLEQVEKKYSALDGMTLRTFVRYNYQQGESKEERFFGSVGLSAGIPLKFGPHRNLIKEAEKEMVKAEEKEDDSYRKNDLLKLYHEYQNKKFQLVGLYFRKARFNERLRKHTVSMENNSPDFSPLTLLADLDEKMAVEMEITDLMRMQYLTVLKIQELLNGVRVSSFVENFEIEELTRRYGGNRSLYLTSETFRDVDNASLLNDFKLNEIREVFISTGENYPKEKLDSILNSAYLNDIAVFKLIGNSEMLSWSDDELKHQLENVLKHRFSGLHIDTEPFFPDNREEIGDNEMVLLIEMFVKARTFARNHDLYFSVSIPDFLPEKYTRLIYNYADKVMLKTSGTESSDTIVKNLREEFAINRDRSVLVVKPSDYSSRIEMESVIEKVMNDAGIKNIAIDELSGLRDLEKSGYSTHAVTKLQSKKSKSDDCLYRIQIAASPKELSPDKLKKEKHLGENVSVFYIDGYYKYTILVFDKYQEALKKLHEVRQKKGLEDAILFSAQID